MIWRRIRAKEVSELQAVQGVAQGGRKREPHPYRRWALALLDGRFDIAQELFIAYTIVFFACLGGFTNPFRTPVPFWVETTYN